MNMEEFHSLLESRITKMRDTLAAKSKEYSTNDDKFHNFRESAKLANESEAGLFAYPADEAAGFMRKHIVSIFDLINDESKGGKNRFAMIDEKIGDAINYLVLIEGMLIERHKECSTKSS